MSHINKPLKVYKSSAGSGKTTTLSLEYLKLALGRGERFRHILALTFTNKAAQEMKDRILDYLQEIIEYGENRKKSPPFFLESLLNSIPIYQGLNEAKALQKVTNDANQLYKNLIHRYSEYAVTTIDSFTNRIIKAFSHDLGLSFNYQVELKTSLLIELAVEELLSRIDQEESLLTQILSNYSQIKINDEKSRNIRGDLSQRAKSLLNDLEEEYLESLRELSLEDLQSIQKGIQKSIEKLESDLVQTGQDFLDFCSEKGIEKESFSGKHFYTYFERIASGDLSKTEPNKTVQNAVFEDKWSAKTVPQHQQELILSYRTELIEFYNIIQNHQSDYQLRNEVNSRFYPFMVLLELEKILNQMKSDQQMIHISDFNKVISKNVAHETAPYIYERIGNKFQHYLLDEFQDTSVIQWHNLIPLVENGISEQNFSLVVGDAKQSIYRWRGSDVKQFSNFPQLSKPTEDPFMKQREQLLKLSFEEVHLQNNYRTGKNIVEFNNLLFDFIKKRDFLPENLKDIYEASDQIVHKKDSDSFVQLHLLDSKEEENAEEAKEKYIEKVYQLVQQCQEDGYALKDIAVLAGKNKLLIDIARYLLEKGIPVISTESLHADSSPLVKFVLSFINHLYFPTENLYQSEIIYFLSNTNEFGSKINFKESIEQNEADKELSDLWEKLDIQFHIEELIHSDTYEAIEQICELFQLDRTDSLLHFFLEAAFIFSQENHQNLNHFLEWWEINAEDYKLDVPEDWEAVKLLTFHKSKGLEFPIVINLFGDVLLKSGNFSPEIWLQPEFKDVPLLKAFPFRISSLKNTDYHDFYQYEKDYSILDQINVFYVAMTRPKERLYVLADVYHPPSNRNTEESFKYSKLIQYFIEEQKLNEVASSIYQYGENNNPISKTENSDNENQSLNTIKHDQWRDHIPMSLDTEDEKLAAATWGTKVHRFFAAIKSEEDLNNQLEQSKNRLLLSDKELKELEAQAKQVLQHPKISHLYKTENLILNERDFYTANKKILRPDRIIKSEEQLFILDYKTGKPNPKNEKQIQEYCEQLEQLTGLKVKGYLVYLHENIEIVEVEL